MTEETLDERLHRIQESFGRIEIGQTQNNEPRPTALVWGAWFSE